MVAPLSSRVVERYEVLRDHLVQAVGLKLGVGKGSCSTVCSPGASCPQVARCLYRRPVTVARYRWLSRLR